MNLLIIGADVTHPAKEDDLEFSVCSVVASLDSSYFQYASVVKIQEKSEEIIKQMDSIIIELLDLFVRNKINESRLASSKNRIEENDSTKIFNLLPAHILFFRDGISDTQYNHFQEFEIKNMYNAFKEFSLQRGFANIYSPKINSIIVLKRHVTRFRN